MINNAKYAMAYHLRYNSGPYAVSAHYKAKERDGIEIVVSGLDEELIKAWCDGVQKSAKADVSVDARFDQLRKFASEFPSPDCDAFTKLSTGDRYTLLVTIMGNIHALEQSGHIKHNNNNGMVYVIPG